jgi:hypothetical protein
MLLETHQTPPAFQVEVFITKGDVMKQFFYSSFFVLIVLLAACGQPATPKETTELDSQALSTPLADSARAVVANNTEVYTAGYTAGKLPGSTTSGTVFLRKYTVAGKALWTRQFANYGLFYGAPTVKLALAPNGDVYVVDYLSAESSPPYRQITVRKYDGSGNLVWRKELNNPGGLRDVELRGSTLYLLTTNGLQFSIYRLSENGQAQSTITKSGITNVQDLAFDSKRNFLVLGSFEGNKSGIKVLRYSPTNGALNGSVIVDTSERDGADKMVLDSKDNLYISWKKVAVATDAETNSIAKYDSNLGFLGNTTLSQSPNSQSGQDITGMVIRNDVITVAGYTQLASSSDTYDAFSFRLTTTGNSVKRIANSTISYVTKGQDLVNDVAVSSKTFVVGSTTGNFKTPSNVARNNEDAFIIADNFSWFDQ